MSHVGCASASAGPTSRRSSVVRPRNGPPDAVSTSDRIASACSPAVHCSSAECSESTGSSRRPERATSASTSGPPATSDSLLASARSAPERERRQRGVEPGRADDGVQHDVGAALLDEADDGVGAVDGGEGDAGRRRARRPAARSASALRPPARATTWSSGSAAQTASAWAPTEPVAPRIATRFIGSNDTRRHRKGRQLSAKAPVGGGSEAGAGLGAVPDGEDREEHEEGEGESDGDHFDLPFRSGTLVLSLDQDR